MVSAPVAAYAIQRAGPGRSTARISSSAEPVTPAMTSAYGRASCAYLLTPGSSAKTIPASRPTRAPNSRPPSTAVIAAASAIASSAGVRSASADSPNTPTQARMKR